MPNAVVWLALALVLAVAAIMVLRARRRASTPALAGTAELFADAADASGQAFELRNLKHRAADNAGPDAVVRVANGFSPQAPIHLVVYNHGFYTDVRGAYDEARLAQQLADAPGNVVLLVPEWQRNPRAASGDQGRFSESGMFAGMVQDVFDLVPPLSGKTLADVIKISILGHSAGYGPAESEIYNNGLGGKIVSVTLLDALYDRYGFDRWLQDNIRQLNAGRKRFLNVFYSSTANYSKAQAQTVKRLLAQAGLRTDSLVEDYDRGAEVMDAAAVAAHPLVFKYSSRNVDDLGVHFSIPVLYVRAAVLADVQL